MNRATLWRQRSTFLRLFNLPSIALVFWICFGVAVSRMAPLVAVVDPETWVFETAYFVRQSLVSGLLVLAAVALAEAVLPVDLLGARRWLALAAFIGGACLLSVGLRTLIAGARFASAGEFWFWFAITVGYWSVIGLIGAGLAAAWRRATDARARLLEDGDAEVRLAARALEARVAALQAQIEPHFLFNTLANVRRLYEVDPALGRRMLGSLLDYLRAALPAMRRSEAQLAAEFDLVRSYLTVLQHRMGERLRFEIDFEPGLGSAAIPPLIIPTLVENAVRHGLAPLAEGGTVRVGAVARDNRIVIAVTDDGVGFSGTSGSGVGLANTRARLAAQFGADAALELRENRPRGVIAEIHLPARLVAAHG